MRYFDTGIHELCDRDLAAWRAFAAPDGRPVSPYLMPEFARAIADVRDDVRVVVAEEDGSPCAFFAYHCGAVTRPVGAPMSDYQGVVARKGTRIDTAALMAATRAGALVYENWTGSPAPGRVRAREGSAVIDISDGAELWFDRHRALFKDHFKKTGRRARKAGHEFGPARLVLGDPMGEHFETLKAWKSAQYRASAKLDLFSIGWVDAVLSRFAACRFGPFRGLTSALYYGDRLAAVEFGLVAGDVYHSWFPAYDPDFASASPGLQLLHALIEAAPRLGVSRIDLGKGEAHYKKYYADYEVPLAQGRALTGSLTGAGIASWDIAESVSARLPGPISRIPAKLRRRWAQTSAFEPDPRRRLALMTEAFAGQMQSAARS